MALLVGTLGSCGAPPITSDGAPSEDNIEEETTSIEEGRTGEGTPEPTIAAVEPSESTPTSPATGASGMVSSAHPLATQAGLSILADGGNAFDAAVAVGAALGVVEPYMSGIGGYGAMVIYDAEEGEARVLDSGSRAPATLDPDVFRSPTPNYVENRRSAKAAATPGVVNVWQALSDDYGELEWRRLFDPAIKLADQGFTIGERPAYYINTEFSEFPEHAKGVYGNNGAPLRAGGRLVQRDLARSLGLVAEQGAQALQSGELGQAIDSAMRENGGFLTIDDLLNSRAEWRDTTGIDYRGYEIVTASPPIGSWNALLRLGIISQFDVAAPAHNSADYLHRYAEVTKRAYEARLRYDRDPEVSQPPLNQLLSEGYWADEAARINPLQATAFESPTSFPDEVSQEHTTHYVVADRQGNVVSATQTLGNLFGGRVVPRGTGIWINDSIAFAHFEPKGNPLDVFPGRYRLIGICPTLVMRDEKPWVAIGTLGGRTIVQTVPQMLMNLIDFDMDIQQAIAAPRISFVEPNSLAVEGAIPESVRNELSARGHNVSVDERRLGNERGIGNAHGLIIEYDSEGEPVRFTGGADPRGEGVAVGY
ncbi:MAG: gamma-glutamyltransferase [Actinomycetota bacterium]|nr:gamma-glutamyltransferase [Actinomycetota bacterium]